VSMDNYSTGESEEWWDEYYFKRSVCALSEKHDDVSLAITENQNSANNVIYLNNVLHLIIKSNGNIFSTVKENGRKFIECKNEKVFDAIKKYYKFSNIKDITSTFPLHKFNPYIQLFFMNLKDKLLGKMDFNPIHHTDELVQKRVDMLNEFIDSIRKTVESSKFKADLRKHQLLITKNHNSLLAYIDNLFKRHSRLMVLRVDFGYTKDIGIYMLNKKEIDEKYLEAKKDREHFFNNMRSNKLFDNMLGYAWKLEFASLKGFHYHMFFFFDGSKVREDVSIAMMIGEYWKKITGKRGIYYNCNAHKDDYDYLGIGMINYGDTELMENLKHKAAPYLTKTDYYAKIHAPDIGKTFSRGEMKAKVTNRGRPRKNANTA